MHGRITNPTLINGRPKEISKAEGGEPKENRISEIRDKRMKLLSDTSAGGQRMYMLVLLLAVLLTGQPEGRVMAQASPKKKTVVVLGDSLAAGFGVEPSQAFPALLQEKINAAGMNYTVVNAGVSGDTSSDGLNRINWLLKRRVNVLILELGGNDGLRGIEVATTKANLQSIIDRVKQKYPDAKIVVAGMQMPPNMGEDYTTAFRKLFPELAEKNQAALVPFLLEGVGGKPELNQPDHIHPTVEGHKIVAENVWKVLKPVLTQ
jgi:acyl-CoA thioesterase-1